MPSTLKTPPPTYAVHTGNRPCGCSTRPTSTQSRSRSIVTSWLPTPAGPFILVLGTYAPGEALVESLIKPFPASGIPSAFGLGDINATFEGRGTNRVDALLVRPCVNYNFPDGWYVTSSPIITANWEAMAGDSVAGMSPVRMARPTLEASIAARSGESEILGAKEQRKQASTAGFATVINLTSP